MSDEESTNPQASFGLVRTIAGLAWVLFFVFAFFRWGPMFPLPGDVEVTRSGIVTGEFDKGSLFGELVNQFFDRVLASDPKTEGWQFFQWRLVLYAMGLVACMTALGRLLLRVLKVDRSLRLENTVFGYGLGVSAMSLIVLGFGLTGVLNAKLFVGILVGALVAELICCVLFRTRRAAESARFEPVPRSTVLFCLVLVAPMLLMMLLGALSPPTDFDVREYHLQGPKEYFQNGQITFLAHNAYTSFPFLTEMLSLLGMVVTGDWYEGALLGKVMLASFAPMTGLALIAAGRRCFDTRVGWLAAVVFLTTPWVYRISIIAYAEGGLTFFLFASLLALTRVANFCHLSRLRGRSWFQPREGGEPDVAVDEPDVAVGRDVAAVVADARSPLPGLRARPLPQAGEVTVMGLGDVLLVGLLCGSAMACKYPALLSVVVPCGIALLWFVIKGNGPDVLGTSESQEQTQGDDPGTRRSPVRKVTLLFAIGVAVAVGPWLLKNLAEAGNPVYPLGYSVFGGTDWTPEINARWKAGHSPPNHKVSDLAKRVVDVTIRSDWMSPLLFAFAPLALLVGGVRRKHAVGFWLFVLWMFGSWWVFTHRIDRFWVPMIPVLALLAGAGLGSFRSGWSRVVVSVILVGLVGFNTIFASVPIWGGYNAWFKNSEVVRNDIDLQFAQMLLAAEKYNQRHSQPGRVLSVGEAAVFETRSNVLYNTVFDLNLFQQICGESVSGGSDSDVALRSKGEVRSRLAERDVRFIVVNWLEILRYRAQGSYGFSEFVRPENFEKLVEQGVLRRLDVLQGTTAAMSEEGRQQVMEWGSGDGDVFAAHEIFEVL